VSASIRRIETVELLGDGQELVCIHPWLVRPVLAVDGELHEEIDESPDVIQHAREREVEEPIVALGRGRSIEWTEEVDSFLENLIDYEAAVLEATGTPDDWQFQLRFRSYEMLSEFYRACIDDGVGVQLNRVHNPVEAASRARFGLTEDQEQTLVTAFEGGYFDIPRGTTISELGEELEISDSAVSQRLRRANSSLIAATLLTAADTSLSAHQE
jgi:hypothetical protein